LPHSGLGFSWIVLHSTRGNISEKIMLTAAAMGFKTRLTIILSFVLSSGFGKFHIDKTGYEQCIFNMVDYNTRESFAPIDFTEAIIVQNQGYQLWTVTILPQEI